MHTFWIPHWTTLIALGCGVAGAFYPGLPPASKGAHDSQEKFLGDVVSLVLSSLFVGLLVVLGGLGVIFLTVGWSRSSWVGNVAGAVSLLWLIGRLVRFWLRLPDPKGTPRPTDSTRPLPSAEAAAKGAISGE